MFSSKTPNYLKLKTNLKLCINRLKLLEKKKTELALKARKEIADYIAIGKDERARIRVEHIVREDYLVEAMEIIEMLCDLLLARFGLLTKMKELDPGLEECIATLLWAAPRLMSDVSEMKEVAHQLTIKYGKEYAEMCKRNGFENVHEKVLIKMSTQPPPKILIENYMIEIARAYNVPFEPDASVLSGASEALTVTNDLIDVGENSNNTNGGGASGGPPGGGGGYFGSGTGYFGSGSGFGGGNTSTSDPDYLPPKPGLIPQDNSTIPSFGTHHQPWEQPPSVDPPPNYNAAIHSAPGPVASHPPGASAGAQHGFQNLPPYSAPPPVGFDPLYSGQDQHLPGHTSSANELGLPDVPSGHQTPQSLSPHGAGSQTAHSHLSSGHNSPNYSSSANELGLPDVPGVGRSPSPRGGAPPPLPSHSPNAGSQRGLPNPVPPPHSLPRAQDDADDLKLPTVPNLPSVPDDSIRSEGKDDIDFDDLTRRFEELKKRK